MGEKLRFGLIGCGRVAPRHAQSLAEIHNAELVAVADVIESRAANFQTKYNVEAYTDYHEMIARDDLDVITICTPSGLHASMVLDVIQAGKHVIVEKPIALSTVDADRMIKAAEEANVKLCVILQNRFNPPMQDLYKVVKSGKIGKLHLGNVMVRWYRPQSYYEDGWHGTWAMDGGALMNQSIHHIDAIQWLMGDVDTVYAMTGTLAHKMEAEDVGVAVLRFKSGALASVEGSTLTYPENLEGSVSVFGERGSLKVGGTALNRKTIWKIDGELEKEREVVTGDLVDPPSVYGYSHKLVIEDMIDAVLNDRQPQTHGREGRRSLALVEAIYQSAREGIAVKVTYG
ncbi:MAG: Gfo/Idh/MocA family oxidoreductase [Aggregatilineales bacterium]